MCLIQVHWQVCCGWSVVPYIGALWYFLIIQVDYGVSHRCTIVSVCRIGLLWDLIVIPSSPDGPVAPFVRIHFDQTRFSSLARLIHWALLSKFATRQCSSSLMLLSHQFVIKSKTSNINLDLMAVRINPKLFMSFMRHKRINLKKEEINYPNIEINACIFFSKQACFNAHNYAPILYIIQYITYKKIRFMMQLAFLEEWYLKCKYST